MAPIFGGFPRYFIVLWLRQGMLRRKNFLA